MDASPGVPLWSLQGRRLPLRTPYEWARGTQTERHIGLVCHNGTGWGEMAPPPHQQWSESDAREALFAVHKAPDLAALDGLPARLRCGASTAWMDSAAHAAGLSLAAWLGERIDRTPARHVPVNMLLTSRDPDQLRLEAMAAFSSGFATLKLKVGMGDDVARVAAVREGAPKAELRLDANAAWAPDDAATMLEALAAYDIAYIEQPVAPAQRECLRALTGGDVPIALDESATDPTTIRGLRDAGIGDVFILKPQRLGGLDRTLEAIEAAGEIPVTITNSLESAIGVTATLHVAALLPTPTACGLATSRYFAKDVATPPTISHGHMTVPTRPGLGVVPREVSP